MNRKLIRRKLAEVQSNKGSGSSSSGGNITTSRELNDMAPGGSSRRKQIPPEQTNAENFYYIKQMSAKNSIIVIMGDGEEIQGQLEWYDRDCIKVNRTNGPNLVIMKRYIKYLYKGRDRR